MKKKQEEEVTLRLQFESKMNTIHSIHWNTETLYQRALSEIDSLTGRNLEMSEEIRVKREEIHDLNNEKNELYSKTKTTKSELRYVKHQLELMTEEFEEVK